MTLAPGTRLGPYQIAAPIGTGGMATVYLADDLKHHRKVAVKVMRPDLAVAIGQDRFLREIEIAARLSHPHILPLFDSGAEHGQLFFVMPFIEGPSLRALLAREKQLSLEEALRLTREIASALGYAHQQGLVHRDIKPENVLLADGIALVADFGIARVLRAGEATGAADTRAVTATGITVGTPKYMAPEQAMGSRDLDGRADLYALACVLYEMLAGQPPFTGATESVLRQHLTVEPRPVTELRPTVPSGVAEAIAKGLAKIPADRYATAARFAEALATAVSGGPTPTPSPAGSEQTPPNNLPRQRTHFIGREKELVECARLLSDTRLLTLTGIGGSGKTRLALRLAESLLESYPDGVWWVDLTPIQDPSRVAIAVASALDVRERPGTPLSYVLAGYLSGKRALLVLDNCEHVLRAAAELVEPLLAAGADLRMIVTSREGLGVTGEQTVSVQSMSVPASTVVGVQAVRESEAARLFVDRARLVEPRFGLDAVNAPKVAEICRRLDGIPLAIELAAARVKVLSVEEIRSKLDDRFRLLTGGSRAIPRHQTLQATIQWSYDHLAPEEQRFLRQLAVFAGGWTLDAATAVAGQGGDEFAVLELLTRLVDKSLVIVEREGGLGSRYRMLETVRQYAQERLDEWKEGDEARTRHLKFYVALAEDAEPKLQGPEQGAWLSRLDRERENLLAAHRCRRPDDEGAELGLKLVSALWVYWHRRGLSKLGHDVTIEALNWTHAKRTSIWRRALEAAGRLSINLGHYGEARGHLEECLSITREAADEPSTECALLQLLGDVALGEGDLPTARGQLEESVAMARNLGNRAQLARSIGDLGEVYRFGGALDLAEPLYQEALALYRALGDHERLAASLLNLAMVAIAYGAEERARGLMLESLAINAEVASARIDQLILDTTAGLAARLAEWARAAQFFGAAQQYRNQTALPRERPDEAFLAPLIAKARGALGDTVFAAAEAGSSQEVCNWPQAAAL